jgi:hypothetical protein
MRSHLQFDQSGFGFQSDKLPLSDPGGEAMVQNVLLAGAAILVVILYGYRSFSRERKNSGPAEMKAYRV